MIWQAVHENSGHNRHGVAYLQQQFARLLGSLNCLPVNGEDVYIGRWTYRSLFVPV